MARLPDICLDLATRLGAVLQPVSYPAPAQISGNTVQGVVYGNAGSLGFRGSDEQEWLETIRLLLYAGNTSSHTPSALAAIDLLIDPIADLFRPDHVGNSAYRLGGMVDFCTFAAYETGQILEYAGQTYYGATVTFNVKRRRLSGSE